MGSLGQNVRRAVADSCRGWDLVGREKPDSQFTPAEREFNPQAICLLCQEVVPECYHRGAWRSGKRSGAKHEE